MTKRLILVGGGHAHVFLLHGLARRAVPGLEVVLVSPYERHHYSGMVPGYLRGAYTDRDLTIDLPAMCRAAGAQFVQTLADSIHGPDRIVQVGSDRLSFDLASVDVGCDAAHLDVPGARDHAYTLRPMSRVAALRDRLEVLLPQRTGALTICVVGAGAAGVEVALALEERTRRAGRTPQVTLFNAGLAILPDYSDALRARAERILGRRGIAVRTGRRVERVEPDAVVDSSGDRTKSDLTVWLTGAAPTAILHASELPKDPHGYFLVDATLRSADGAPIWGAGDCIGIEGCPPLAKAGVYAVRESPILDGNIRAHLSGGTPVRYDPQGSFLALLNTADGKALLRWKGIVSHSRWAWWLKDWIDRGFVGTYST